MENPVRFLKPCFLVLFTDTDSTSGFPVLSPTEKDDLNTFGNPIARLSTASSTQESPESQGSIKPAPTNQVRIERSSQEAPSSKPSITDDDLDYSKFKRALLQGDISMPERLLPSYPDLDECRLTFDDTTLAPIHYVCDQEYTELETQISVIKWLLEHGSSPNSRDSDQCTPMHYLASWNNVPVAILLLEYGADVNLKDCDGATPLHITAKMGAVQWNKFLLELPAGSGHKQWRNFY